MNINLLVTGPLYSSQSAYSALRFCEAAVATGNTISQVFFYQDGVTQASKLSVPLDDEFEPVAQWARFAKLYSVPLVICISAGERRGVMKNDQVIEYHLGEGNAHESFSVAGLGVLHEASLGSDRTVTFK